MTPGYYLKYSKDDKEYNRSGRHNVTESDAGAISGVIGVNTKPKDVVLLIVKVDDNSELVFDKKSIKIRF